MKWFWQNYTQLGFGEYAVRDHLSKFVKPKSKVLCTFGGGSIDKNGARSDVQQALDVLECDVRWEGGILPNPEYERLVEISNIAKEFQPDILLGVGAGSVLDGTKFISFAARLPEGEDPWEMYFDRKFPENPITVGSVMTLPATGSEWDNSFVISRRSLQTKLDRVTYNAYPTFSLLDPRYTTTLPPRQLRNGVFDAFCHCVDQYLTGQEIPLMDNLWLSLCKELIAIGPDVVKSDSSIELRGRLMVASSFALNGLFELGKEECWAVHTIGHQITAVFGVDHGATLSMVMPFLLENQFNNRIHLLAKSADFLFGVKSEGSDNEDEEMKARRCIEEIRKFIKAIEMPLTFDEWKDREKEITEDSVEVVTKKVMESMGNKPFGFRSQVTEDDVKDILKRVFQ